MALTRRIAVCLLEVRHERTRAEHQKAPPVERALDVRLEPDAVCAAQTFASAHVSTAGQAVLLGGTLFETLMAVLEHTPSQAVGFACVRVQQVLMSRRNDAVRALVR